MCLNRRRSSLSVGVPLMDCRGVEKPVVIVSFDVLVVLMLDIMVDSCALVEEGDVYLEFVVRKLLSLSLWNI